MEMPLLCSPAEAIMFPSSIKDRKSTRLNSSHSQISYAVFCLKKKKYDYSIRSMMRLSANPVALSPLANSRRSGGSDIRCEAFLAILLCHDVALHIEPRIRYRM